MKFDFQLIHNLEEEDIKKLLINTLKETTSLEYYFENVITCEDDYYQCISIKYNIKSNGNNILGFTLNLNYYELRKDYDEDTWSSDREMVLESERQNIQEFIFELSTLLQDNPSIIHITKYYDKNMQDEYSEYYRQLFELEMKLREVISFIFLDKYTSPYELTNEFSLSSHKNNDFKTKKEKDYKDNLENEFFYLLFSDYSKLNKNNLKKIDDTDIIKYMSEASDFDEFKTYLTSRGIVFERFRDFLAEIQVNVKIIENFRNCIAHNRSYFNPENSNDTTKKQLLLINYEKNRKQLLKAIDDFWMNLPGYMDEREQQIIN